jgi:hypothetical protein
MKIRGGESTEDEASLDDETVDVKETRLEGKSSESGGKLPSSPPRKPETPDKEIDWKVTDELNEPALKDLLGGEKKREQSYQNRGAYHSRSRART